MALSIVIVNYKSSDVLEKCLESVYASKISLPLEVIVVDNDSKDQGLSALKDKYTQINFIRSLENKGFAGGCNLGIRAAHGEWILLLNPDTEVNENAIQCLYNKLVEDWQVGIVGPKIYNSGGSLQMKAHPKKMPVLYDFFCEMFYLDKLFPHSKRMNSYYGADFNYDKEQYVEQVCGACLMVKREVAERIGLLDEKLFLYFDETDWCRRATKAGCRILYVPSATVLHHQGRSSNIDRKKSTELYYESQLYLFRKHYGVLAAALLYFLNLVGFVFRIFVIPIYLLKDRNADKIMRHFWALLYHLNPTHFLKAMSL